MLRVIVPLALLAFTVYAVVDCIQTEDDRVRNLPKLAWVVIVLLFTPPVESPGPWPAACTVVRPDSRESVPPPTVARGGLFGRPGPQDRPRGPRGPDDDPDFLKNL
ncbi:MAG: PLDc N-terminal domain-containing protein [Austwickia sp.]|nr:PLDc N-terminal domain-containing protein [Austwickia sp.]